MFGRDVFAGFESELDSVEMHDLRASADEVHFDTAQSLVVRRVVTKCGKIEIGAEFTVGTREDVEVESRRHIFAIVVGAFDDVPLLFQIISNQKAAIWTADRGDVPQETHHTTWLEISDGRTWEKRNASLAASRRARQIQRYSKISD